MNRSEIRSTPLSANHLALGGRMVDFAGWNLPVDYAGRGIISEHLACRRHGALFDICHMGRFSLSGDGAASFLDRLLTNRASKLAVGRAQYTILATQDGRAVDDCFLYRFDETAWSLVVNAANLKTDLARLKEHLDPGVELVDESDATAMMALQGPLAGEVLARVADDPVPPGKRNHCFKLSLAGVECRIARTGYTGEPIAFEIICPAEDAPAVWQALVEAGEPLGVVPAGLGARDTLRLEAALPLYGHELSAGLPLLALPQAAFGVDLSPEHQGFIGRAALAAQRAELDSGRPGPLVPQTIRPVAALGRGMIRDGSEIFTPDGGEAAIGRLTSATMVPAWRFEGDDPAGEHYTRAIGLALMDTGLPPGLRVEIAYRNRRIPAQVADRFMICAPPYLKAVAEDRRAA